MLALRRTFLTLGSALSLTACGDQASTEYAGRSLLTMNGRIEVDVDSARLEGLQPSLAFIGFEGELRFVGVEILGEFPSDFTLDVYDRPPAEAFFLAPDVIDQPKMALAHLTAVSPGHPEVLWPRYFATSEPCSEQACEGSAPTSFTSQWCASPDEDADCYEETRVCAGAGVPIEECTLTERGDSSLRVQYLSYDYGLVYLDGPAAPGSFVAHVIGAPDGAGPGYHLLEVVLLSEEEIAAGDVCEDEADERAVERFNELHDTAYSLDGFQTGGCDHDPACPSEDDVNDWDRLRLQIRAELECHPGESRWQLVSDPAAEDIKFRLSDTANWASPF